MSSATTLSPDSDGFEPSHEGRATDPRRCVGMIGAPRVTTAVTGDRALRKAETAGNHGTEFAARSSRRAQQFFTTISR
jgi:hypothetical protein